MPRMIDQVRASKLPSNMMQFSARFALAVPPAESIEIMVYLARHNKVFGELARLTLAGWDEKSSLAAASDPNTSKEVLDYFLSPDNLRPKLLPALLQNPSVAESELAKFAISASHESIEAMLLSPRVRASTGILDALRANPYLKAEEQNEVRKLLSPAQVAPAEAVLEAHEISDTEIAEIVAPGHENAEAVSEADASSEAAGAPECDDPDAEAEEVVSTYLAEHAAEIEADAEKPFQAIGMLELLGPDYFPVS